MTKEEIWEKLATEGCYRCPCRRACIDPHQHAGWKHYCHWSGQRRMELIRTSWRRLGNVPEEGLETLSLDDYKTAMEGIYTTTANQETLDESPMAYKRMEDIIDARPVLSHADSAYRIRPDQHRIIIVWLLIYMTIDCS